MPKSIKAAGGVVFRVDPGSSEPLVLLIYRNGYWDIPKGKLEKGESISMCAAREVAEETDSDLPIVLSDLGTTYHEYTQKGKDYGKTTYWYSMIYPREQDLHPQRKEGIEDLEWVSLQEAKERVDFENLREVLNSFSAWFMA